MKSSHPSFPKIGFVVAAEERQLVLSNSIIFGNSKVLTFPMVRVKNNSGQELVKGDKILYTTMEDKRTHRKSMTVKKILAHNLPIAPTIGRLLLELRIAIECERDVMLDKERIRHFLNAFVGVSINLTTEEEASLIIRITGEDKGAISCPYPLMSTLRRIDAIPFQIEVPYVSDKTITFLHRVSEPTLEDVQLKLAVLSLRILHVLLHAFGYKEHIELSSVAAEYEARIRGDPSLVKRVSDLECLMSWRSLHLLASTYDTSESSCLSARSLICKSCQTSYATSDTFGFSDFEALMNSTQDTHRYLSRKRESEFPPFCRHGALYVLETLDSAGPGLLLGVSPIRSRQTIAVSHNTSMEEIENKLLNGVGLIVPLELLEREAVHAIGKGDKLLVEFAYDSNRNDRDFLLSSIRILKKLSERHRIDDTSSILYRLGVRRTRLTIQIKWASDVDKTALREAAEQVRRLTGWKVLVDNHATAWLDWISAKMDSDMKKLAVASGPEELRKIVYDLQDTIDKISPLKEDVVDKPVVVVFILPELHYMPISTMGDMALGLAKHRLFSILPMPGRYGPVHLHSETCKECPENYSEGRNYRYSHHLSVLLIHELLHITADLPDHRGECRLCYFDKPQMLPLRFSECEKCIKNDGYYVHKNCLMSYACQFCIASRLTEIKDLGEVLCDTCVSKIRPETNYVHSYFARINQVVYAKLMVNAGRNDLSYMNVEGVHSSN